MNTTIKILVMTALIIGLAFFSILSGPALMFLCGNEVPGWDHNLMAQEKGLAYFIFLAWAFTLAGLVGFASALGKNAVSSAN
jgi:hypothetical protein